MENKIYDSKRWLILVILWAAIFVGPYSQYQIPPLAGGLIPRLNISEIQFSSILTAPMIPAIFFSIVSGVLCDRFGFKKVIGIGFILTSIGLMLRFKATGYSSMFVFMLLSGFSATFLNSNLSKIVAMWFAPSEFSRILGVVLAGSTAAMAAGMATANFFPSIDSAFLSTGVASVIITIVWFIFMKERPSHVEASNKAQETISVVAALKIVSKSRAIWTTGICLLLMMGTSITYSMFLPMALTAEKGLTPATAGLMSSVMMLGSFTGAIVGPIFSQKIGYYRYYLFGSSLLVASAIYFGWLTNGLPLYVSIYLTGVISGGCMPIFMSYPVLLPEIGPKYAGSAGGFIATIQLIGAVVIPTYIIAPIAKGNFKTTFAIAAICAVLYGILALTLPELGPKAMAQKS